MCTINYNHMMYASWYFECDEHNFLSFSTIFCTFRPLKNPKNLNFEKMKKKVWRFILLQKCTKNHDHMLYCSWDTACDECNCYFSFWTTFCPFTPLTAQKWKFQKNKKMPGDAIILHKCTKNHKSCDTLFLRYGAWQM